MKLKDKTILCTGGSGSFGQAFTKRILQENIKKIIIFSRGEHAQVEMSRKYPPSSYLIRYFIGDVRDGERLHRAFQGVDIVVHAAALKHVDVGEYNPSEVIKTTVIGTLEVINAAINNNVKQVLAISTDKAVNPACTYGAAKLCSDKTFLGANKYSKTKFTVVRFGNFYNSRGSVVEYFNRQKDRQAGFVNITDFKMERFFLKLTDVAEHAIYILKNMKGGEIFTPDMTAVRIIDLAHEIYPNCKLVEVGVRDGEKIIEDLVTETDMRKTKKIKGYYVTR